MANQKPLPALPAGSSLTTLSVESRNHRARLIRHFIADIIEPGIENRRDGWAYVFEEALDDLSEHMDMGDWLSSIKRGNVVKRNQKNSSTKVNESLTATNVSQPVESGEEKKEEMGKGNVEEKNETKPLPAKPEPLALSPLKLLHNLAARPPRPPGEPRVGHLALCIAPHGSRIPLPVEDSGFDIVPANIGCVFSSGSFALQELPQGEPAGSVLYGLDGLERNLLNTNLRLVGGTFTFKGVNSPSQHQTLAKVLRLSIFVHISLLLEQHVLSISQVQLKFPRPKFPSPSPSTPVNPLLESQSKNLREVRLKARKSIIPSSFTNFLKRNISRSQTINPPGGRGDSLDITVLPPSPTVSSTTESIPRKPSEGFVGAVTHLRLRRFSFMGDHRISLRKLIHSEHVTEQPVIPHPFLDALKRVEESKELLSGSTGVTFLPPKILLDLVEKEKSQTNAEDQMQKRRLKGDERVALSSLLGWDGKDAEGRGMSGVLGFVRHQEISFLCSLHLPLTLPPTATSSAPISTTSSALSSTAVEANPTQEGSSNFTNTSTVASTTPTLPKYGLSPCGKPHWVAYQYYSSTSDRRLGEWIQGYADNRNLPCDRSGCAFTIGRHERRMIHDGVKVVIRVADHEKQDAEEEKATEMKNDDIEVWESCAVCHAKTSRVKMNDGAYLFSFAKFLEMLIYSPALCRLTPTLCEHTTPPSGPWASLPSSRFNIIRHFSTASADISLALCKIEDIFELRVPRLQITRGLEKVLPVADTNKKEDAYADGPQKKMLRREIRKWWEGVSDHIDKIEEALNSDAAMQKILPRLPSVDEAYDVFNKPDTPSGRTTPKATTSTLPSLPPIIPDSPSNDHQPQESFSTTESSISTNTQASETPTVPAKDNSEQLLAALRHNFQKIEQSLYIQLAKTPETSLNDVRRSFIATGKGTQRRLKAWQKKHLGTASSKALAELVVEKPEWWGKGYHAVPGGNIIVRENDWGSIIAHTLSTVDYQLELANLSMVRSGSSGSQGPTTPVAESGTSSFFSVATGYKLFTASLKNQPDPDQEGVVWDEPEQYFAEISRKNHVRDPTSLLSLRDVLRHKTIPERPSVTPLGSRSSNLSATSLANNVGGRVSSVKAKADVAVNTQAASGSVNALDRSEAVGTLLQELETSSTTTSRPASVRSEAILPSTESVGSQLGSEKAASIISTGSNASQTTIGKDIVSPIPQAPPSQLPPPLPPKDVPITTDKGKTKEITTKATTSTFLPSAYPSPQTEGPRRPSSSGLASSFASGINSAMRYVLNSDGSAPSRPTSASVPTPKKQQCHSLLADVASIDERPHIKYDWTIGKRLKFSCTVYYAKQFDVLRKRCGINDTFLNSLSTSANWTAEGGKSKSNFWKTSDDRFIIKTLVNAWNVADLQVLAELAPSYFRYMDATASKATALAKLIGFYTIEVKNLETGSVQSKADLLVMENLFFDQKITKTFDLKGIQGRKVKTHGDTTKTLFDGEWIEGQQRTLTLVRPHSKVVLREAIKSDAEFLSKSNIMDYSLLLGVNEEKKEIVCGLVDTIGSYTFAKTLEYKAKHGLLSGKEVTVVPPTEYQERFVSALEGYFVACPDKWSKPLDDSKIVSDPNFLPSVL